MKTSNKILFTIIGCIFVAVFVFVIVVTVKTDIHSKFVFSFMQKIVGNGNIITKTYPLGDFTAIDLRASGQAIIKPGSQSEISITTDQNILPYIQTDIKNNVLRIKAKANKDYLPSSKSIFVITAKNLSTLTLNNANQVLLPLITGDKFKLIINGVGEAILVGSVKNLQISILGKGMVFAKDLTANKVDLEIDGIGEAILQVLSTLNIDLSGSGKIKYYGDPEVTRHVSGTFVIEHAH
jgi:hypothetical protein